VQRLVLEAVRDSQSLIKLIIDMSRMKVAKRAKI